MKLNVSEYRWILLNCNLMVGLYKGKQYAVIEPKFPKYQAKLDLLLGSITFPSIEEWNKLSRELRPKLKENNRIRHELAVRKLTGMSNEKIAALNNKQRLEILDGLLQDVLGRDMETFRQNKETISTYKDQLKILLFGIRLPQEFLDREKARCEQFCHRLQSVPRLKEDLESWQHLEFAERKDLSQNIINAFNASYRTAVELRFFNQREWQEKQESKAADTDLNKMKTAYTEGSTILISREKIAHCDNLAVPALIFHEALEIARRHEDWSRFPLIDKLSESKFAYLALGKDELYTMNPMAVHAYEMDTLVADFLLDKMKIKFIENPRSAEISLNIAKPQKARMEKAYPLYAGKDKQ